MTLPATLRLRDGTPVLLRSAQPGDAEAHIANSNEIMGERVYLMSESFRYGLEEIRSQFREADPSRELWLVAEVDGRVVGGADFRRGRWEKNAHTGELGLALRKEWRGRGLGEALLREGISWARASGIRKLKLGVFATNTAAIALYRKLGFQEEARLKGEVILNGAPADEVLMALWL
jgi:RimJ/RimL family protein N-acetyltransferase